MGGKIIGLIWAILICLLISICTSCKSVRYVTVPEYHTDTLFKARKDSIRWKIYTNIKDSVSICDSVIIRVNSKGEVIGKDTWHWRSLFRNERDSALYYKNKLDSVLNHKVDSVPVPYPVTKTVIKHDLLAYQRFLLWSGVIAWISIISLVIWRIKRKL